MFICHVPRHHALDPQHVPEIQENVPIADANLDNMRRVSGDAEFSEIAVAAGVFIVLVATTLLRSVVIKMKLAERPTGELKFEFVQRKTACTTAYAR